MKINKEIILSSVTGIFIGLCVIFLTVNSVTKLKKTTLIPEIQYNTNNLTLKKLQNNYFEVQYSNHIYLHYIGTGGSLIHAQHCPCLNK